MHLYVKSVPQHVKRLWSSDAAGLGHLQGIHRHDWLFGPGRGVSVNSSSRFNLDGPTQSMGATCIASKAHG